MMEEAPAILEGLGIGRKRIHQEWLSSQVTTLSYLGGLNNMMSPRKTDSGVEILGWREALERYLHL